MPDTTHDQGTQYLLSSTGSRQGNNLRYAGVFRLPNHSRRRAVRWQSYGSSPERTSMQVYRSVGQRRPRRLAVVLWCDRTLPPFVCQMLCHAMPCAAMRCDAAYPPGFVGRPPSQLTEKSNSIAARPLQLPLPTAHTAYRPCCMHTQPNTYAQSVCTCVRA